MYYSYKTRVLDSYPNQTTILLKTIIYLVIKFVSLFQLYLVFPLIKMEIILPDSQSGCSNSLVVNGCIYTPVLFVLDLFQSEMILSFSFKVF